MLDHLVVLFLIFLRKPPYCFPKWLHHSAFSSTAHKDTFSLHSHQHSEKCEVIFLNFDDVVVLICISLEKAMAPHSSTLAWKIPWMEEPAVHGVTESNTTEQLHFHFPLSCIGEGNGNPLQCSCLENPRDGGAWWAALWGLTESDTTEVT